MQIRVETATKEVLTLDVVSFETIETIKERIEEIKGIPTEELHLFFQGKKLQDNRNLEHYDIEHQSTLLLKIGKSMTIFVQTATGKPVAIDVLPTDTIADVKAQVFEKRGIVSAQQQLYFNG